MDAKELRIGNLLSIDGMGVVKVGALNPEKGVTGVGANTDEIAKITNKKNGEWSFTPIPLTEEWLVKFGFGVEVFVNGTEFSVVDGIASLNYREMEVMKIKYVHQLQNLYFALSGEELTIKEE